MSIYPSKDEVTSMKPVFCTCYTSLGKHAHLFAKRNYLYKNVKVLGKWRPTSSYCKTTFVFENNYEF